MHFFPHAKDSTFFISLLVLCLGAVVVNAAPAKKSYNISGSTSDELVADLDSKGPNGGWGKTDNNWTYTSQWEPAGNEYKIKSATVKWKSTITMPSWSGYNAASKCLKGSWDKMYKSLQNHENKHVDLASGVEAEIKAAILALPPQPSSSSQADLNAATDATMQQVIDANNAKQQKFDADTDHGKSDPNDPVILSACP